MKSIYSQNNISNGIQFNLTNSAKNLSKCLDVRNLKPNQKWLTNQKNKEKLKFMTIKKEN